MAKYGKGKGKAFRFSKKPLQKKKKHPSRTKLLCYQVGIPVATAKVHLLIPLLIEAAVKDAMHDSLLFAYNRKTLQSRDMDAAIEARAGKVIL